MYIKAPVAQWIERPFPKRKAVGSTPTWRVYFCFFLFLTSKLARATHVLNVLLAK